MGKVDCVIYGYLVVLAVFGVAYGFIVLIKGGAYTPGMNVNVILPPGTINNETQIANATVLQEQLIQLNTSTQVKGVVIDVWWGLVELTPQNYTWDAYEQLFLLVNATGLKVKAALNFHACKKSDCDVDLPSWILDIGEENPDIYYTDQNMNRFTGCLSSGVDYKPLFPPSGSRTGVEVYIDFIQAFADHFNYMFDTVIYEVKIGLGPDGELRYPSYPDNLWEFPGIGEFQCFDQYLLAEYKNVASKNNKMTWSSPPNGTAVGTYNSTTQGPVPSFFTPKAPNNYQSEYGQFFLNWYSNRLVQHGQSILGNAASIISVYSPNVTISAKWGCVYWQYDYPSHPAELTAGYKNDNGRGYDQLAKVFANIGVNIEFACFGLLDNTQPAASRSGPVELVAQTLTSAQQYNAKYEGQNLQFFENMSNYGTLAFIEQQCRRYWQPIVGFDFRDLEAALFVTANFDNFERFVTSMSNPGKLND